MQIVENFGTQASSKSEKAQVTLSNPAEILAVFPELGSKVDKIPMEYDYRTDQHLELTNQVIIKKCIPYMLAYIQLKIIVIIKIISGQDVEIRHYPRGCELLLQG
jgi:hypothetical protein